MAKGLNFRNFAQPTLPIVMNDAEATLFTLTAPTVELVERLQANQDEIVATFKKGDDESIAAIWGLAADLISCNREGRKASAEELKGRYGMTYKMLYAFLAAYFEFIDEIEQAKN